MLLELKKAIIDWLITNKKEWQRTNACVKAFKNYIYDDNGNYLIGGQAVSEFIVEAEKLLFKEEN